MHPDTYLNKIVLGTREGQIQLWNVATKKLIYTFQGWGSPVTCIVQSPAVDVVAIGLADGRIMIHNLKYVDRQLSLESGDINF
jgi:U3 small nucleolar RNA-associated protein 21